MRLRTITPPDLPVSLEDVKLDLRVEGNLEDGLLFSLIRAAHDRVDLEAGQAFGPRTVEAIYRGFPTGDLALPTGPVGSVVSITYLDADGVSQIMPLDGVSFEEGARDAVLSGTWPAFTSGANAVVVRYVAGDPMPEDIKHAIRLLVGHWYQNRETAGGTMQEIPYGVTALVGLRRRMFV